jgi:hypothetical protein
MAHKARQPNRENREAARSLAEQGDAYLLSKARLIGRIRRGDNIDFQ